MRIPSKEDHESIVPKKPTKEEPMTEMKRVPYKINHCEEGDMFEEFSCSSDFDKVQPIHGVGKGLLADPKK